MSAIAKHPFIPICCVCGLVRDEYVLAGSGEGEPWSNLGSYLDRYHLRDSEYKLTHTYCPDCAQRYLPAGRRSEVELMTKQWPPTITALILQTIRRQPNCNLDALVRACPQFSWNQVFLEVDRLSRIGEIELSSPGPGQYTMNVPVGKRTEPRKSI